MKSVADLKTELKDAKYQLRFAQRVAFDAGGSGMTSYSDRLTLVTRLQSELNSALKAQGES